MALNYIWIAFFLIAFIVSVVKLVFLGDLTVFPDMVKSTFDTAKTAFEISLGLTGVLTLWMGLLRIGERGGIVEMLARGVSPFFHRLFPELPRNHPVNGHIMMNFAANMLGLDNAATPIGLKAMDSLQELNPKKDTASNAMIMFLVLNASGLTLIPVSIMVYRQELGAAQASDIFLPLLFATFCSTIIGLIAVALYQRINLLDKWIIIPLLSFVALIGAALYHISGLPGETVSAISSVVGNLILFSIITFFLVTGIVKKVNVYDAFIDGAKEGFTTAIKIIPYLVAILVAIGVFRSSGAMDWVISGVQKAVASLGFDTSFIPALPTAIMKPLSGSGARGMMIDTMKTYGADSFPGRLSCIFQGAADTTFFIMAVYYGAVNVKNSRYTLPCALLADLAGVIAAIWITYFFFG